MKKRFTSFAAGMLVIWYLLSVIGFDVHTCTASGETFIATVVSGFSCEEIHPQQHPQKTCGSCCGCRHHDNDDDSILSSLGMKSCCTGDFQVISLTGTPVSENNGHSDMFACQFVILAEAMESNKISESQLLSLFPKPRSWISGRSQDFQASYGIWRI